MTATTLPDFLAAIEHGLGFTPEDSLVAVAVRTEGALGVHVRLDAAPSLAHPAAAARWAIGHARTGTRCEGIIAALYTHAPADEAERLLRAVAREAETLGLTVHLAFHVGAHGWTELRHQAAGTRQQAKDSALYAQLVFEGSVVRRMEPEDVPFAGPDDAAARIEAAAPDTPYEAAAEWTALLDSGRHPVGSEAFRILANLKAGMPRDFMIAATAGDLPAEGTAAAGDRLVGLLLGRTGARPDWARIDRAENVLGCLLAEAPDGHRAGALTFLGWIAWYRGTSSAALTWFARAEQDSPGYRLAALLTRLIGQGELPEVAKDPGIAYHRR
ncbi:DUF4192 family protein [Sinomonas humi]|nr:DUF4192 family protein [Sinomonas humi]